MSRDDKLWEICMDIYRQMFKEADPPADFDLMLESGEAKTPNFFGNYYLSAERQNEIIDDHCKKHNLRPIEKKKVSKEIHLGCSPSICRRGV